MACFAYGEFYDPSTGQFSLPTEEQFVLDVIERLQPKSDEEKLAAKAESTYDLMRNVRNLELEAIASSLACA